jgi:oligopeptide/dipeptide ABC transporter ATP-binding protein
VAPLLQVESLTVEFPFGGTYRPVVREASLTVERGEFVGLAGESGSGKTLTALAILRLVPAPGRIAGGRILLEGRDLLALPQAELREVRGGRVGMVFQEPMTALNPVLSVGAQIAEAVRAHSRPSASAAAREAERLLDLVAMPRARQRLGDYPHQLSGGQRQRVMIAMALAARPDLLLADEPTTALDVTIQAQILELLDRLRRELGLAVLLISHDLAVLAENCERLLVMYAGRVVEEGAVEDVFRQPGHPYTRALLASLPAVGRPVERGHLPAIPGQVPEAGALPGGCAFHPRCSAVMEVCREREPDLVAVGPLHARCFLHGGAERREPA